MKLNDANVIETLERKNDLESYIYAMRNALQSHLQPFVQAEQVPDFMKQLYFYKLENKTKCGSTTTARTPKKMITSIESTL